MNRQQNWSLWIVYSVIALAVCSRGLFAAEAKTWPFPGIGLRVPVTVKTGIYPRKDALVAWRADFAGCRLPRSCKPSSA